VTSPFTLHTSKNINIVPWLTGIGCALKLIKYSQTQSQSVHGYVNGINKSDGSMVYLWRNASFHGNYHKPFYTLFL
jgi:hypothetical protein